jgi:hypothetical protein
MKGVLDYALYDSLNCATTANHPMNRRPLFHLNKVRETLEAQSSKVGGKVQESRGKRSLIAGCLPKNR